ncbi:GAF domain-containing protein [Galbitalea soli]|uniref:GAF domain-containing protein n=1 Tax=Galbitalea soli TaxID=1268042 RepID=A0A7C9TTF7_9MICO|nr:GAF domain-containing protein [Galbitalea soli]NYJ29598.1 hypothetical protein [Galbitalea soli]
MKFFGRARKQNDDSPVRIEITGVTPDRILFVGSGAVLEPSRQATPVDIPGLAEASDSPVRVSPAIARAVPIIAEQTGRGLDAWVVRLDDPTLATGADTIGRLGPARFDAVVLAVDPVAAADSLPVILGVLAVYLAPTAHVFLVPSTVAVRGRRGSRAAIPATDPDDLLSHLSRTSPRDSASVTVLRLVPPTSDPGTVLSAEDVAAKWGAQLAAPLVAAVQRGGEGRDATSRHPLSAEEGRQAAVEALGILDTEREERFDTIVRMAQKLLGTESATFTLIDREREWLKSSFGVPFREAPRAASLCNTTIQMREGLTVEDASTDPRFADSPLVTGDPNIRFYLGFPVESPDGHPVGAICVFDPKPREPDPERMAILRDLALLVERELAR